MSKMNPVPKLLTTRLGWACFALALVSCGGGDNEGPAVQANGRVKAQSVTPPPAFFPNVTIPSDANTRGMWSPVYNWPGVPVHATMLSDGRILTFGSNTTGKQTGHATYDIWDSTVAPDAGHLIIANNTDTDIFCSSSVLLPPESPSAAASVFIAGGDIWNGSQTTTTPNSNSTVLDVASGTLTRKSNMQQARWYSSSITLVNGETYIQGGLTPLPASDRPEVRSLTGTFRPLSNADTSTLDWRFPRNFVAPDGRVFGYDSNGNMYYVNASGNGSLLPVGQFDPQYANDSGSAAMFRPGRILQLGGNSNGAVVIDITGGGNNPVLTPTQSLSSQRQWVNATILADGKVLATSGSQVKSELIGVNTKAEIWDPITGQWMVGPAAVKPRLYHSNAIMLPDASVLVSGGGATDSVLTGPADNLNAEIYYPPYFFTAGGQRASRPIIDTAPSWVDIGSVIAVSVANATSVSRVTLVKTGASTHSFNMDQRFLDLTFSANGLNLSVQAPARAADATPGYYMLFVFNQAGVPSVAKIVRMGIAPVANPATVPVIANPGARTTDVGTAASLTLSATDPNGDTLTYSASGLPTGMSINAATGVISGTPSAAGSYNVLATVSDGINVASTSFLWTVNEVNGFVLDPLPPVTAVQAGNSTTFTASSHGGVNVTYRWNFGDGTGDTAWSPSATVSHSFAGAGTYSVTLSVTDASLVVRTRTFLQTVYLPATANKPSASSNIAIQAPASGNPRLWVVNQDNDSVTSFDAVTRAKLAEVTVGSAPRSIAVASNGLVWVTNKRSDSISVIDPSSNTVVKTIALPRASRPFGIAMSPTNALAFVVLESTGQLQKFDTSSYALLGSASVGANPRQLSISADGASVYVSRFVTPALPGESTATITPTPSNGAEVVVISAGGMSFVRTIVLQHSEKPDLENQGRGIPNYLGAATISPDGTQAWVPSKQDNIKRGVLRDGATLNFQNTVRAVTSRIVLGTNQEDLSKRVDHDNSSVASAAVYDSRGVYLFVALETSREVAVVDAHGGFQVMRFDVGRAPQGLAMSGDGKTLYVNNFMDRTVGVYDLQPLLSSGQLSVPLLATLGAVATDKLSATVLLGKQHFYDARDTRLARDRYMSCASCHNDGGSDGRTWDFTGQGEGLRNTIALRGRAGMAQGMLHWSGNFDELQDFEGQIRALAGGTGLMSDASFNAGTRNQALGDPKAGLSADLDALAAYLTSLDTFEPSPNRDAAGALSATGATGRAVFQTQGCASCHGGTAFTNSGLMGLQNVGTLKASSGKRLGLALNGIDIPTLRDVWRSGPYLHDGSAATLEAAVLAHNTVTITAADLNSLAQYLREIGAEEVSAPGVQATGLKAALAFNEGTGTSSLDLAGNGHTATLVNGPTWATGQFGKAVSFDGVDDAVTVAGASTLDLGASNFTVELWTKRNALGGSGQRHLFSKCHATAWQSGCKELYFYGDVLYFGSYATGDTASVTIADTAWHHIAMVFTRATNTVQIYVDGTPRTTATMNFEADNAAHLFTIGNLNGGNPYSGLIDEVRLYGVALTAAQVASDMGTPVGTVTQTPDTTAPTVSVSAPAAGATVSGVVSVSANASDNIGVAGVQFLLDGVALGAEDTTAPYSLSWTTTTASNGTHSLTARALDAAGNQTTSATVSVTVSNVAADTTPPTVSISAPAAGATVSGTVSISASAADNIGVAGVQFLVDGANLGAEVTAAPYTLSWATATAGNGAHSITARARDAAGNQTTSTVVSVTVSNAVPVGLIAALGFNETSGTSSADLTGNGHTATLVNSPAWVAGQYGNGLSFNGSNNAVTVGNASTLDFGASNFTLMMWTKRNALGGGAQRHLFSKCDATAWQPGCKELYFAGDVLNFGSYATGDITSVTIADTSWHHIAVVFTRATNTVQIYVDGTLRTTATQNLEADNAAHVLTLGNLNNSFPYSGLIDELRFYNQALTAAQVGSARLAPL